MNLRLASATALGILASATFAGQAHAGAFAYSNLLISNFVADSTTTNTLGGPNSTILSNGTSVNGITINVDTATVNNTFDNQAVLNGALNASAVPGTVCSPGSTCPASVFTPATPFLANGFTSFGQGGTSLTGAIVAGLGGGSSGATANAASQAQVIGSNVASAHGDVGVIAGFNFSLSGATGLACGTGTCAVVDFNFSSTLLKIAGIDATGASAQASTSFTVTLTDNTTGAVLLSWTPTAGATDASGVLLSDLSTAATCGRTVTNLSNCLEITDPFSINGPNAGATAPGPVTHQIGSSTGMFEIQAALPFGDSLNFTISHTTLVQVKDVVVPEPTTVALFATGLLMLGWAARRRRQA